MIDTRFTRRGFLPEPDPLAEFPPGSPFSPLDSLGRDLPSLLHDKGFRAFARNLEIPGLPSPGSVTLSELRLYYVRLGFLASAYVNQVGRIRRPFLPRNIAVPLCEVCPWLGRPPILSYDGYALFNWKRFDPRGPSHWGTSTRSKTSSTSTTSTGSSWSTSRSRPSPQTLLAIAQAEDAMTAGDSTG